MNVLQHIERANYLASASDIEKLAALRYETSETADRASSTYFRILLAHAQTDIAGRPTLRARRGPTSALAADEIDAHLKAFEESNARVYAAVLKGIASTTDDPLEKNRRSNFARTAASAIRTYIRGGGDLTRLVLAKTTKAQLQTLGGVTSDPAKRAASSAQRLLLQLETLGTTDAKNAREVLSTILSQASDIMTRLGGSKATTRPETAVAEHRLLKTPAGTFWPMSSGVQ